MGHADMFIIRLWLEMELLSGGCCLLSEHAFYRRTSWAMLPGENCNINFKYLITRNASKLKAK